MKYTKPSLTFSEQADLLVCRGLEATREEIIEKLKTVNYYRLSAYWYPFRQPDDSLLPGTTLAAIWQRYTFDRQLRLVMMDAVERVEIAIRTQLVYHHTQRYGPFGYLDRAHVQGISVEDHRQLLERIREEARRSGEDFVKHFYAKYRAETDLPLWMASELMTFGNMLTLFRGIDTGLKQTIAGQVGVADRVLESWLRALNQVRNICAHHGRMWNRVFGLRPLIPRENKHPEWHRPVAISNDRVFGIVTILQFLLAQVAPQSAWKSRLLDLLGQHPDIPVKGMGFPLNWTESPIWK